LRPVGGRREIRLEVGDGKEAAMQQVAYPVRFTVDYPDRPLDRLTTGCRIFVAIPILIVLGPWPGKLAVERRQHPHRHHRRRRAAVLRAAAADPVPPEVPALVV
jgi:hypothetical protein